MSATFQLNHHLTEDQIRFYNQNGYIHFKNFISKEEVNLFISEINNITHHLVSNNISKINGTPLKFGSSSTGEKIIQRLAFTSQYSNVLSNFLKDPRLSSLFQLLGRYEGRISENEKDGLVVNHYENTPFSKFKQLGWHTDSPRDLFLGSKIMPMLNVGLHLDDHLSENGGLKVLPGTHKQGLFKLLFRKKYFVDNNPDPKEIGFNIEAGDLTIHSGHLWHRVQQSTFIGEKSRRRVMYIPIITGKPNYKTAESKTPFYHRIGQLQLLKFKLES